MSRTTIGVSLVAPTSTAPETETTSFKDVKVIVADHDLAPEIDGVQNVWIEKVGCGTADVNFSS